MEIRCFHDPERNVRRNPRAAGRFDVVLMLHALAGDSYVVNAQGLYRLSMAADRG